MYSFKIESGPNLLQVMTLRITKKGHTKVLDSLPITHYPERIKLELKKRNNIINSEVLEQC